MDQLRGQERNVAEEQEWENERGGEKGNRLDVVCVRVCGCVGAGAGGCSWRIVARVKSIVKPDVKWNLSLSQIGCDCRRICSVCAEDNVACVCAHVCVCTCA